MTEWPREELRLSPEGPGELSSRGALRQGKATGCVRGEDGKRPDPAYGEHGRECLRAAGKRSGPRQALTGNGSSNHLIIYSAGAAGESREEASLIRGVSGDLRSQPLRKSRERGPYGRARGAGGSSGRGIGDRAPEVLFRAERGRALCGLMAAGEFLHPGKLHLAPGRDVRAAERGGEYQDPGRGVGLSRQMRRGTGQGAQGRRSGARVI